MILTILIILFTLIALMALHEFGHFLVAKKFGVKVEEFGIGYPPRLWGRKIGETIYSLNLLPFGAFVKILGSDKRVKHPRSFSEKPLWQRGLILFGGVVSFWLIAYFILIFVSALWGVPTAIPDDFQGRFNNPRVQIWWVVENSPAEKAGIEQGDIIKNISSFVIPSEPAETSVEAGSEESFNKVSEVQEFVDAHLGEEITLTLQRGKKVFDVSLVPRVSPPANEGPLGISLARVADAKYPWLGAPYQSAKITAQQTVNIPRMLASILTKVLRGEKVVGVQFMGPVGIGQMLGRAMGYGFGNFLSFISMISIWLALFNLFPIPALDGGRLLFLAIEGIRKKPVSQAIEQKITTTFFILLVCLMAFVTLKDILRLF